MNSLKDKINEKRRVEAVKYLQNALKALKNESEDCYEAAQEARVSVRLAIHGLDRILLDFPEKIVTVA